MNGHVVVDASLAFKWLVKEIYTAEANDLGRLWNSQGTRIAAPYLMPVEVTNALHHRVARGELTLEAATRHMESLLSSGLEFTSNAHPPRQGLGACKPAQAGRGVRRPLPGPVRDPRLRTVDRRREVLPGGQPVRWERTVDRRVRRAGIAGGCYH